jgi:CheY-like chemotaxis protein
MTHVARTTENSPSVAQILKNVDKLVKMGDMKSALDEVLRAKSLEPRNMYVHAYEERIRLLEEERERNRKQEEARRLAEEAAEMKRKAEQARLAEEARRNLKEEYTRRQQLEAKNVQAQRERKHAEALAAYNAALRDAWQDGAVTPEEDERLKKLRSMWGILMEEHFTLQAAVKRECYMAAFKQLWASGTLTPDGASTLAELRRKFRISAEEYEVIESELLQEFRSPNTSFGRIAIIDDDVKLLESLKATFEEAAFQVDAFETSDEAYAFLQNNRVDLILSDINLESSTMGGFAFYEHVRRLEHLMEIPFLFLSGLTDEAIVCAGKELGVDDYITKPFDIDTLIAVVKGKIRRYKAMKSLHPN